MAGRRIRLFVVAVTMTIAAILSPAQALGSSDSTQFSVVPGPLGFSDPPRVPIVPTLPADEQPQTLSARMDNFTVNDASGAGAGWSLSVSGDAGAGRSPVLRPYCTASCGASGVGYTDASRSLPSDSLILDSRGASFRPEAGSSGAGPSQQCDSGCFVDTPPESPSKIAMATDGAAMGSFRSTGFSKSSFRLMAPNSVPKLRPGEEYRVDLVWTLISAP